MMARGLTAALDLGQTRAPAYSLICINEILPARLMMTPSNPEGGSMFKRILVPVDGSPTSNRGLEQAIRLARGQGGRLILLHVVDEHVIVQHADAAAAITERFLESLREVGRHIVARAQAAAKRRGVPSKAVVVENILRDVADVIVGEAKKQRADVIVMGTHGRRGVTRVVMGSDAEGVVRTAPVPVLLVRAGTRNGR
jgi:nucleotide-binding universal stress UspA family protein